MTIVGKSYRRVNRQISIALTFSVALCYYQCMDKNPLQALVADIGTYRLAKMVGVKHPTIHSWLRVGRVPATRVIAIEAATGGRVTRYDLRPDVFGPAPDRAA